MRLILFEGLPAKRVNFHPLALSRSIWELRCGMTSLGEKLVARVGAKDVAGFVPEYLAEAVKARMTWKINDASALVGDELLIVNARLKAADFNVAAKGKAEVGLADDGEVMYARIPKNEIGKLDAGGLDSFLESAKAALPNVPCKLPAYNYIWDLILANPSRITEDFLVAGKSGVEGTIEQPCAVRGSKKDVFIGAGAVIHPMVVLDAVNGPIYLDEGVEVHPFTRIEGPCFVGAKSILLGAKCREGNSIGPACRVGGEVEESIIQGYSNKYHDGFLGHAYVGEWVNLGALTANSDLKNDYGSVSVVLDGKGRIDTGSTKVGALIGDHTKTSIGTLFNTGAYVGAMCTVMAAGRPLTKFIPSFTYLRDGQAADGFGRDRLYATAKAAMARRNRQWTQADRKMWDAVYELTADQRNV